MTIVCISCPAELPEEHAAAVAHFSERKVYARFINGIHAETFGILAWRPYRRDDPKSGFVIKMSQCGLALSHYMAWQVCEAYGDDEYLILEDDAEFPDDWKSRLDQALLDVPDDWEILMVGNSNCSDKPQVHVRGQVFEVKYPFCTHAYMVKAKSLVKLLQLVRDAAVHIDISLIDRAYPVMRVYTVLPRIVSQRGNRLAD